MWITLKLNETELFDESRGNCVSGNFRNCATFSSLSLRIISIVSETRFSENHPGVVSTLSSPPQSSPRQHLAFIRRTHMVTVSMTFLVRMSSKSEGIPKRGSSLSSLKSWIFTTMCFRVCIEGRSMSARLGLTSRGSLTRME